VLFRSLYGVLLTIGVAAAVYGMLRRLSGRFWFSCILTTVVCSAFLFNGMPRPVFFSMIMFCVTLSLLFEAQGTGKIRRLYWLPLLFLFWGNLHIQFVYGLFIVGLFVAVALGQQLLQASRFARQFLSSPALPVKTVVAIFALCLLATVIGPNFYRPYLVVLAYSKAKFAYAIISELQPLSFRGYSHFAELFIAAAGFYAVGWQKKLDPFKLILLTVAAVVAFRTVRDAWFICFSASACIADSVALAPAPDRTASWRDLAIVSSFIILILLLAAPANDFTERGLDRAISRDFPVNAINFLRQNPLPGPLYNNLNWGGFLMWYLPQLPVAVDGRNDLYGDELDRIFFNSETASSAYTSDPYLNEANVVILDSQLPLARVLTVDPRFTLVYQDAVASVFARR